MQRSNASQGPFAIPTVGHRSPGRLTLAALSAFISSSKNTFLRSIDGLVAKSSAVTVSFSPGRASIKERSLSSSWVTWMSFRSRPELTHPGRIPFSGDVSDGFIWGRGTLDDKSGVIAVLEAVELLLKRGFQPRQTVFLAFGHDEEIGGQAGAGRIAELLKSRSIHLEYALDEGLAVTRGIVPGLLAPAALIGIAEKGFASIELSAEATGGHSSMPPPSTAVGLVAAAVHSLEDNPMRASLDGPAALLFDRLGPRNAFCYQTGDRKSLAFRKADHRKAHERRGDQRVGPNHHCGDHHPGRSERQCLARAGVESSTFASSRAIRLKVLSPTSKKPSPTRG